MGSIGSSFLTIVISLLSGPLLAKNPIEPKLFYSVQDRYLQALESPFQELEASEKNTSWGSETVIGNHFAQNLDFYRAITAFRRAEILTEDEMRKQELQYKILLSYYLGRRYKEVEQTFETSLLSQVPKEFPPFHDLLVILYDTYLQLDQPEKSAHILQLTQQHFPQTHEKLLLYTALKTANLAQIQELAPELAKAYKEKEKSRSRAVCLNAIVPGSGYFYLGLYQTSLTAFLMNALFLTAALYFFKRRPIAAAIIFLGFEAGWYFGGISGARMQTKLYNERVYEQIVCPTMNREGIFPVYQLKNGF